MTHLSTRQIIFRILFMLVAIGVVTWFFPHNEAFRYDYEVGKPWRYGRLTAPYDFAIYRSDSAVMQNCLVQGNLLEAANHNTPDYCRVAGVFVGVGTLIASLASLITFSEFRLLYPGHGKRYFCLFTLINFVFLIIMTAAAYFFFI